MGPIKSLRTLRALRPLRALSRFEGMRVRVYKASVKAQLCDIKHINRELLHIVLSSLCLPKEMNDNAVSKQQNQKSLLYLNCNCIITSLSSGGFNDKLILMPNLSYFTLKNSFLVEEASG